MKRFWFLLGVVCAMFLTFVDGDGNDDVLRDRSLDSRIKAAVERAFAYLAQHQEEDGSFKDVIGRKTSNLYVGHYDKNIGVTALAAMAFMSWGHLPGRGKYGSQVEKALNFILDNVDENGIISYSGSRMYEHAFATLFLAEIYGMVQKPELKDKLRAAISAIERAQNKTGGWRYMPTSKDADISVTVCQVMALRAARNAGIAVDKNVIANAINYVKRSAAPDGSFCYQIFDSEGNPIFSRRSFALTAAGVVALQGAGLYDAKEVKKGVKYLYDSFVVAGDPPAWWMRETFEYFYAHYYAIQAIYQEGGDMWERWHRKIANELLDGQHSDGRWEDKVGPNYATAMAVLILGIPNEYLPIFQR